MQKIDLKEYEMDIKINCINDYNLSYFYYKENFKRLSDKILFYKDFDNLTFNDFDFNKLTKKELLLLLDDDFYTLKNNKDYLSDALYANFEIDDILEYNETILKKLGYIIISSYGHSQGDYINILIDVQQFKKVFENDFTIEDNNKLIDNLLWDAPIYLSFELNFSKKIDDNFNQTFIYNSNDADIFMDEYFNNIYDIRTFNKDNLIKAILNDLILNDIQLNNLNEALNLDYNDIKS